ncbi:MAG: HEAT repeat domain-containing protein [Actinomycetota bacterium]
MAPPDLSTLTWTTRAEVAAQLARYLRATGPPPDPKTAPEFSLRVRAAELLWIFAGQAQCRSLRTLALNLDEEIEVRHKALSALTHLGAGLSGHNLERLLSDGKLCGHEDLCFGPSNLLTLARRPDAQAAARKHVLALSPDERGQLLAEASSTTPTGLFEWMYSKWLNEDRMVLARDHSSYSTNQCVIRATIERAESRSVLQEMWRDAVGDERLELLKLLDGVETVWEFPAELTAMETTELAEALALPSKALVAYWGRERLLETFDTLLLAEHERLETQQQLQEVIERNSALFSRMLRVLNDWLDPAVDEWVVARLIDTRLHGEVRWWLTYALRWRNRGHCANAVTALLETGERDPALLFVEWAARDPIEPEWPMLREAARPTHDTEIQYHGLLGLERLGESGDVWKDRLDAWTRHPEPRLQIRALGALARRGVPDALNRLIAWVEGPHPLLERAEAIAVLTELDAASFIPLFVRVLAREERPEEYSNCAPAAEEAALALARIGTSETLTVLLRCYLTTKAFYLQMALVDYMSDILAAEPGASMDLRLPSDRSWRTIICYRWTESPR